MAERKSCDRSTSVRALGCWVQNASCLGHPTRLRPDLSEIYQPKIELPRRKKNYSQSKFGVLSLSRLKAFGLFIYFVETVIIEPY